MKLNLHEDMGYSVFMSWSFAPDFSQNKKKINKVHDDFFDFLNHDFMICNKSSESYFAGQVQPGLGTRYPDGIYDLVM